MNILAMDTSTKHFSLAVLKNNKLCETQELALDKVLSDSMIPSIDGILRKAKVAFTALDGFAVGLGPGSFTSLRVGLSTIKGFCLATQKPVVGISSLDLIAQNIKAAQDQDICVISDAKRNMVYAAIFRYGKNGLKRIGKYFLIEVKDLLPQIKKDTIFVGDGIALYRDPIEKHFAKTNFKITFAQEATWLPRAEHLAFLALGRFEKKKTDNINKIVPLYLYRQDCQVNR
ncbi:MAG: tRNA (adenosine(37)-N6)-threonylcarbamoyltransferase complex dimerization subunit type 1 TsaB [Candidatus Omnitrophota bacterium]